MSAQPKSLWHCREMHRSDLPAVMTLERQSYEFPWTEGIFRDCLRMGYSSWVTVNTMNELLGYALMSYAADEAHILNLCVNPGWRRQGVGRYLLEHLLAEGRQRRIAHVLLEVRRSNESAIELYRNAGFEQVGKRRDYYPAMDGREDALVLIRQP